MVNGERTIARPLRWGMIGGGRTGQVGYKHRTGALRDGTYQLLCGAFDLDIERGRDFGIKLGVAPDRCYADYKELITKEAQREDGVEVVSIATPNFTHFEITKACLEAGFHVICEKPLFFTVAECEEIQKLAEVKGLIIEVTYGFIGHPMVEQMAMMVKKGMLGDSWSNIHLWIAQAIDAKRKGDYEFLKHHRYPGINAGTEDVRWLENCVKSADAGATWVEYQ